MLSDDPNLFALMMPTKNRPAFVERALYFLDQQKFAGHLLCVDASDAAAFEANAQAVERFPGLNVSHHRSRSQGNTWPEIDDALAPFSPKYVQLHHDDDFYFTDEIDAAISVLEAEPDAASAQGRFVYVEKNLTGDDFSIAGHERYGYAGDTATDRLRRAFDRYGHLFFGVVRREDFLFAIRKVYPVLAQGWFDQYAVSLLMAAKGQAIVSDGLFGIRQQGLGNYKHWPLIIASPDFSNIFSDFKRCLRDAVSEIDRVDAAAMDTILDEGLVFSGAPGGRQYATAGSRRSGYTGAV